MRHAPAGSDPPLQVTASIATALAVALTLLAAPTAHATAASWPGALRSWGANASGQLGNGATGTGGQTVQSVSNLFDVSAVDAGANHTIAIGRTDPGAGLSVWTWGANTNSQLGRVADGTNPANAPGPVQGLPAGDILAVAAGGRHSLALIDEDGDGDGTVYAWGANDNGQSGAINGLTDRSTPGTVQFKLEATSLAEPLGDIVAIAAGESHNLAIRRDGDASYSLWAWGDNRQGQLGALVTVAGVSADGSAFNPIALRVNVTNPSAIAAGGSHSLAVRGSDGAVLAWGANTNGQLGNASTNRSAVPVRAGELAGAVAVGAGTDHSLALLSNGEVYGWGANGSGQVGDGTTTQRTSPAQVVGLDAAAIDGGGTHSSAVSRTPGPFGRVVTWGANGSGQLGHANSAIPVEVVHDDLRAVTAVAAGGTHTIVVGAPRAVAEFEADDDGRLNFGSVDVGGTLTRSLTFRNLGPGPIAVSSVQIIENDSDFQVDQDTSDCAGRRLHQTETCTVGLRFRPSNRNGRLGTLAIASSAINTPTLVGLAGTATVTPGVLNITVIPGPDCGAPVGVAQCFASPDQFPAGSANFFPNAPNVDTAEIGLPGVLKAPPIDLPGVLKAESIGLPAVRLAEGIGLPGVLHAPPIDLPGVLKAPPIDLPGVLKAPGIDLPGVLKANAVGKILQGIAITDYPLWDGSLSDCVAASFPGKPAQQISLYDLFTLEDPPACLQELQLAHVRHSESPFRNVGVISWANGAAPMGALFPDAADRFCPVLEKRYPDCGAELAPEGAPDEAKGLAASLLAAQIAGVDLAGTDVQTADLSYIRAQIGDRDGSTFLATYTIPNLASGGTTSYRTRMPPAFGIALAELDLSSIDAGAYALSAMTDPPADAVFDCDAPSADCANDTVLEAANKSLIRSGATFEDIFSANPDMRLGSAAFSTIATGDAVTLVKLDDLAPKTNKVTYETSFQVAGSASINDPTFVIDVERNVTPMRGTSTVQIVGGGEPSEPAQVTPTSSRRLPDGRVEVTYELEGLTAHPGSEIFLRFGADPGFREGVRTAGARIIAFLAPGVELEQPPISRLADLRVVANHEPNDTEAQLAGRDPFDRDTIIVQQRNSQFDIDRMTVAGDIPAGSRVQIFVSHNESNNQLLVQLPRNAVIPDALTTGSVTPALSVADAGPSVVPDDEAKSTVSFDDLPLEQGRAIAGVSANDGTFREFVEFTMPELDPEAAEADPDDDILITVFGDAATSTGGGSYSVLVRVVEPPLALSCDPVSQTWASTGDAWPTSLRAGVDTVVLFNANHFKQTSSASEYQALRDRLAQLEAAFPNVQVLAVNANQDIREALIARQADPTSKVKNNAPIRAWNEARAALDPDGRIRFVDVLGGTGAWPLTWNTDPTSFSKQSTYAAAYLAQPGSECALASAMSAGQMFSDAATGAVDALALPGGRFFYVPTGAAVGRVIGSSAKIAAHYGDVIAEGASFAIEDAVAAGDDFMNPLARANAAAMSGQGISVTALTSEDNPYTEDALKSALGTLPDAAAVHLHSDSSVNQLPNGDLFTTAELAAIDADAGNQALSLLSEMGCNVGVPLQAGWTDGLTDAARVATANAIYGLGVRDFPALSALGQATLFEDLLTAGRFAGKVDDGRFEILARNARFDVYAEKAIGGWMFYGSTLWRPENPIGGGGGSEADLKTDIYTGLPKQTVSFDLAIGTDLQRNATGDGIAWALQPGGGVQAPSGQTVQPQLSRDVTAASAATGALITHMQWNQAETNVDFVNASVQLATGLSHPEPPNKLSPHPEPLATVASDGSSSRLNMALGLVRSVDPATNLGTQMLVPKATIDVFHGASGQPAVIKRLRGGIQPPAEGTTQTAAAVVVDTKSPPARVTVGFAGEPDGDNNIAFKFVDADCVHTRCSASQQVAATRSSVEALVQVLGQDGSVASRFITLRLPPAPPEGVDITISGEPQPSGAISGACITFDIDDVNVVSVHHSLNGGGFVPNSGEFCLVDDGHPDKVWEISYRVNDSDVVRTFFVVTDTTGPGSGPQILLTSPLARTFLLNQQDSTTVLGFRCTDTAGQVPCEAEILRGTTSLGTFQGDGTDHLYTAEVGSYLFRISATDANGNESVLEFFYDVLFDFIPIKNIAGVSGSPIVVKAGSAIKIEWILKDANGVAWTSTHGITLSSFKIGGTCKPSLGSTCEQAKDEGSSGLRFTDGKFQFNWDTLREWAGTARMAVLTLPDGMMYFQEVHFR